MLLQVAWYQILACKNIFRNSLDEQRGKGRDPRPQAVQSEASRYKAPLILTGALRDYVTGAT